MASKLGTIFVELELSDKVYKQKLSEELTSTEATAKGMEKCWQVLGQKSDAVFDAQRRSYENAMTLIKNSTTATTRDIVRAEEAMHSKIKALNEQQYGHQTTLIEGMKKNWLAATAVITTAIIGINKAWDLAKIGAEYSEQKGILDNLANKYKTTADEIVKQMQRASDGLVAKSDLMQVALEGIAKGLKPDQMIELANAAKLLGDTVGQSATESLKGLSEALETGRMKALKGYTGSTIDLKDAFGELADKLTAAEKAQAMYDLIIQHSTELQNQQTKAVDEAADTMERLEADYNNAKLAAGGFFKEVIAWSYRATIAITDFYIQWQKLKAGDFSSIFPGKSPKAQGKGDMISGAGEMSSSDLAALDMELLKRNAAARVEAHKTVAKAAKSSANDEAKAAREAAKASEEARKEAAENVARNYEQAINEMLDAINVGAKASEEVINRIKDKIQASFAFDDLMAGEMSASERIIEEEKRKFAAIDDLGKKAGKSFEEIENAKSKVHENTIKKQKELEKELFEYRLRTVSNSFGQLRDAFSDLASIYDEGSSAAKRWEEAARTMEIAQRAVAVVQAVAAIATQGLGDPYTAFARIAAMAATMASLLATIGESVNSGGSSSAHLPASTVLGAEAGTQSESVSKSFELLKDIYDIENTRLTNIYNELRDLNNNITGLVASIVRTGGVSADSMGLNLKTPQSLIENRMERWFSGFGHLVGNKTGFFGELENFLAQPAMDIGNWLFGGKTKKKITASGISFDSQSIADILSSGIDAYQYADIKTTKSSWFGSSKTSRSTKYGELDSEVSGMMDKVFSGIGNSLVYFAENLGVNVNNVLNYQLEQTKLNLKDMTAEEMNEAISGYISTVSDNAVSAIFGDIVGKYQQLNEGLMETATRLIIDKEIVQSVLEDTGKAFSGTVPQMIAFSEQLISIAGSLENLTDAAQSYVDKFYTDAEKFASTAQSIRDVAGILPRTREDYRRLVESIDLTSEVGKEAYYTLLALSSTADSYYSHLEDIASQRADMEIELLEAQGKTAEALAASRKRELEAMDESLRPLQELIWLTQELGTSLETVTTNVTTEINALISTSSSAASEARRMAQTYKGLIETLEEAQIKIFGGGKAGAQTRLNDIYKLAMTGNADALGKMPAAIDTLLNESLATAHTSLEYRRDQAKSYIALENAQKVSQAMVNWEEYHATLLETQVKVLEEMRDDIVNKDFAELQKHSELLQNISTLLSEQTVQVINGNTFVQDQTGKIIAGNLLTQDQTGKIVSQTAQVITGNATQDVIKNIDALNTSYTAEMLAELVSGGTNQSNSLLSILSSSQTIVTLLGQLVSAFEDNKQAVAVKEIEMRKAEYATAVIERDASWQSVISAVSTRDAAKKRAETLAAASNQAAATASYYASIYANQPTTANKATMDTYLSIADTKYAQYSDAAAAYNTAIATAKAASGLYYQNYELAENLKNVTNALIMIYNQQYPNNAIPSLAYGGIATGSESGYEATLHGTELVVSPKSKYPATIKGSDNSELLAELKRLNAKLDAYGISISRTSEKTYKVLDKFDRDGLPDTRAA